MGKFLLDFERPLEELQNQLDELKRTRASQKEDIAQEIAGLEAQLQELRREVYSRLTPWQRIQIARHPERPAALDYVHRITSHFTELHGDRLYRDDPAIVAGLAYVGQRPIALIAEQKGRTTKDKVARNFGMPHPEGYRKALRVAKLAEKFSLPLLCLIDTAGAYPGVGAEERGQAWAIAESLREFSHLRTRIIVVNLGEGGSGGALAIGLGDRLYMLENAWYSVIAPEGCASILFGDASQAPDAARSLRLTAADVLALGIGDGIVPEPVGGAHRDPESAAWQVSRQVQRALEELEAMPIEAVVAERLRRIREIGVFVAGSNRTPQVESSRKG